MLEYLRRALVSAPDLKARQCLPDIWSDPTHGSAGGGPRLPGMRQVNGGTVRRIGERIFSSGRGWAGSHALMEQTRRLRIFAPAYRSWEALR
jgi:hypothetical protein